MPNIEQGGCREKTVREKESVRLLFEYDMRGRNTSVLLCDLGQITAKSAEIPIQPTALQALFHSINAYGNGAYCDIARFTNISGELTITPERFVDPETHDVGQEDFKRPNQFDAIGLSLVNPNQTFDLFKALHAANVPIFTDERTDQDPLIIIGGASTINPIPYSPFADIIVIGQGEDAIRQCADLIAQGKRMGVPRIQTLQEISKIPGVYVPIAKGENIDFGEIVYDDEKYPPGSVMVINNKASVVISRSCPNGCAFCRLSSTDRYQVKSWDQINKHLLCLHDAGAHEVSIVSASASAWKSEGKTLNDIIRAIEELGMTPIFLADRPEQIGFGNRGSVVLAPEASPGLRATTLQKTIKEEVLRGAIEKAVAQGVTKFTFYSIIGVLGGVGFRGETEEDLLYFKELAEFTLNEAAKQGKNMPTIEFNVMPLMPSPHTNLETHQMINWEGFMEKMEWLNHSVAEMDTVTFVTHLSELDFMLEAILNRGTEDDGRLCYGAYKRAEQENIPLLQALKREMADRKEPIEMNRYLQSRSVDSLPYTGFVKPVRRRRAPHIIPLDNDAEKSS